MDDEQLERLAFAARLCIAVHRGLEGGDHRPCGYFYSIDNPDGITRPVKVCACRYPVWEVRQAA